MPKSKHERWVRGRADRNAWGKAKGRGSEEDRALSRCAAPQAARALSNASGARRVEADRPAVVADADVLRPRAPCVTRHARARRLSHLPRLDPEHAPPYARRGGRSAGARARHAELSDPQGAPGPQRRWLRQGVRVPLSRDAAPHRVARAARPGVRAQQLAPPSARLDTRPRARAEPRRLCIGHLVRRLGRSQAVPDSTWL